MIGLIILHVVLQSVYVETNYELTGAEELCCLSQHRIQSVLKLFENSIKRAVHPDVSTCCVTAIERVLEC